MRRVCSSKLASTLKLNFGSLPNYDVSSQLTTSSSIATANPGLPSPITCANQAISHVTRVASTGALVPAQLHLQLKTPQDCPRSLPSSTTTKLTNATPLQREIPYTRINPRSKLPIRSREHMGKRRLAAEGECRGWKKRMLLIVKG